MTSSATWSRNLDVSGGAKQIGTFIFIWQQVLRCKFSFAMQMQCINEKCLLRVKFRARFVCAWLVHPLGYRAFRLQRSFIHFLSEKREVLCEP